MNINDGVCCQAVYLLSGIGSCYSCKQTTRLFALMALPPFRFDDVDEVPLDDDGFMLSNIADMEHALATQVVAHTHGLWRPDASRTAGQYYWMNNCERCDAAKQGDHFVQEPDGPFWPYTEPEMESIGLSGLKGPSGSGMPATRLAR